MGGSDETLADHGVPLNVGTGILPVPFRRVASLQMRSLRELICDTCDIDCHADHADGPSHDRTISVVFRKRERSQFPSDDDLQDQQIDHKEYEAAQR